MTESAGPHAPAPAPDRNLALELVRVTEAAAMATGRWVGRNDAAGALAAAAANAVRTMIGTVEMKGTIVIGEGTDDDEVRLGRGDRVGDGSGGRYDVAVDPVDGITFTAKGPCDLRAGRRPERRDVRPVGVPADRQARGRPGGA